MKKIIALFVAMLIIFSSFSCIMASAEEVDLSLISSVTIEAQNNQYYEYTNGHYTTYYPNGYDNPEEEFYYYNIPQYEIVVNYTDGSFEKFTDSWEFTEKFGYEYLQYDDGGQYAEPWSVGEHAFNFTILGFEKQVTVNIMERPFESFVATPSYTSVYKNTKGYETERWDSESQEDVPFWYYNEPSYEYTVFYENGTNETFYSSWELSEKFGVYPNSNMWDLQYNMPFEAGEHTVTVTYMGLNSTHVFTVKELSPQNVEIITSNSIYREYTNGEFVSEYNYDLEEYEEFWKYDIPEYTLKITEENGTIVTYEDYWEIRDEFGELSVKDDQSKTNLWGVGKHNFTLEFAGNTFNIPVEIVETDVESISVQLTSKTSVYENTSGYSAMNYTNGENYWCYYEPSYEITVKYKNGLEKNYYEYAFENEFNTQAYLLNWQDDDEIWGPGVHNITVWALGKEDTFDFTIIPFSPKSIEIIPKNNVYKECTNGYVSNRYNEETGDYDLKYWEYDCPEFSIKITFEDNTSVIYLSNEFYYEFGSYLWTNSDQSSNTWEVGEHAFTVEIFGQEYEIPVTIIETDIASVEAIAKNNTYIKNFDIDSYSGTYPIPEYNIKLIYKDGTSMTVTQSNLYDYDLHCDVSSDQSTNTWDIGKHEFSIVVNGKFETTLEIDIIESPVESIEVVELNPVYEYTSTEDWNYLSNNPVTGKIKINYKDNTSKIAMLNPIATDGWIGSFVNYSYDGYSIDVSVDASLMAKVKYLGAETEYQMYATGDSAFEYFEQDGEAYIYAYIGVAEENQVLTIPSTINGIPVAGVTYIAGNSRCENIVEVVVPDSVGYIADNAFEQLENLKTIRLGSKTEYIDEKYFENNLSLENIYINNNIYKDIDGVVYTADGKTLVNYPLGRVGTYTIPSGVVDFDVLPQNVEYELTDIDTLVKVDGVTYTADMKTVVDCDTEKTGNYVMPDTVTTIYKYAFENCDKLESVKISKNVTEITYYAFSGCSSLKSVDLPSALKKIDLGAFDGAESLEKVNIHDIGAWCGVELCYNYNNITEKLYLNDALITDLLIPDGITEISDYAFNDIESVKTLKLPSSIQKIGNYAFSGTELDKVIITDIAKWCEIEFNDNPIWHTDYVYLNDKLITELVIPEGVTKISDEAFTGLPEHVDTLKLPSTVTEIAYSFSASFDNIYIADLTAWCNMEQIVTNPMPSASAIYFNNEPITDLVIPEGIVTIADSAFDGCHTIESVIFPSTIKKIGSRAFFNSGITSYSFADGVGNVEYGEFVFGLTQLEETNVGLETTRISDYMFAYSNIKSATIPSTVTEIAYAAFRGCYDLVSISAPDTLISIKAYAFEDTAWYTTKDDGPVYFGNNFYKYKGTAKDNAVVDLNDGTLSIAELAFGYQEGITEINLPDSLILIEDSAFTGSGISKITIPANVEKIGDLAFEHCKDLTDIYVSAENKYYSSLDGILYNKDMTELIVCPEGKTGRIVIPETVKKIRNNAFNNVGNITLEIANSNIIIEGKAIGYSGLGTCWIGNNDIELKATEGSTIQKYAEENYLNFTAIQKAVLEDESSNVKLDAVDSVINPNTELVVEKVTEVIVLELPTEYDTYEKVIYDISLEEEGLKVQPDGNVTISIPLPAGINPNDCKVFYVDENGKVTDMNAIYEDGYMKFTTNHFSYYALVGNEGLPGDLNGDGKVNIKDWNRLYDHINEVDLLNEDEVLIADVNGDGKANIKDWNRIYDHITEVNPLY